MEDFWKDYEQEEQEAAGGGIIGKTKIDLVWKTFPSGIDQELTLFPAPPCHKNSPLEVKEADKKARLAAKALGDKHGAERDPSKGFYFRVYRDNAASGGRPVTWQGDRFFFEANWTDAGKQVKQSLIDAGISKVPWEGYARIGFFDNPYHVGLGEAGMKEKDQDGNPKFPTVAYIVEVFANEDAARAAIGTAAAEEGVSVAGQATLSAFAQEQGWDWEGWKDQWDAVKKAYDEAVASGKPEPLAKKLVAEANLVDVSDIDTALAQHIPY